QHLDLLRRYQLRPKDRPSRFERRRVRRLLEPSGRRPGWLQFQRRVRAELQLGAASVGVSASVNLSNARYSRVGVNADIGPVHADYGINAAGEVGGSFGVSAAIAGYNGAAGSATVSLGYD